MTKPKPCTHRRRIVSGHRATAYEVDGLEGRVFKRWRVLETLRCVKCGDESHRWSRKGHGAGTEREALKRYGVDPALLPAPGNHKDKPPAAAPLTSWPFPVSAHTEGVK